MKVFAAVAVLAVVAEGDPFGLHGASLAVDEVDLHVGAPTAVGVAVVFILLLVVSSRTNLPSR